MDTAAYAVLAAFSLIVFVGVMCAFVWAARKDGEEDRALQQRLGIRRKTRIGL